jgi:hypothetical protein
VVDSAGALVGEEPVSPTLDAAEDTVDSTIKDLSDTVDGVTDRLTRP